MATEPLTFSVGANGPDLSFQSWKELLRWVEKELAKWDWLVPGDGRTDAFNWASTVRNQWNQLQNQLVQHQSGGNTLSSAVQFFAPLTPEGQLLSSDSSDGQLVLDIRASVGDAAAAFAYAFLKRAVTLANATDRDMLRGAMLTSLPEYGSVVELADRLQRERANTRSSLLSLSKRLDEQERERAKQFEEYVSRATRIGAKIVRRRRDKWKSAQTVWQSDAQQAVANIRGVENTYLEKMRLQAPVEYWDKKAREHQKKEESAVRRLGWFFPLTTITLLAAFWLSGAIILANAPDAGKSAPVALYIVVSGALAFISTIAFWVGRLLTKLYLSEHHLRNDAEERAVMTETYLALSNEAAAGEADRQIILNALFRNTSDGIVKEEGPSDLNLHALLSRVLTR